MRASWLGTRRGNKAPKQTRIFIVRHLAPQPRRKHQGLGTRRRASRGLGRRHGARNSSVWEPWSQAGCPTAKPVPWRTLVVNVDFVGAEVHLIIPRTTARRQQPSASIWTAFQMINKKTQQQPSSRSRKEGQPGRTHVEWVPAKPFQRQSGFDGGPAPSLLHSPVRPWAFLIVGKHAKSVFDPLPSRSRNIYYDASQRKHY